MSTLKDVAALAGVSKATASLALNNGNVNAETRERVLVSARQLNYIPTRIGRTLTTGRSQVIEFLIMTSGRYTDTVRHTALFYYLLEGVLSVVDEAHYSVHFNVRSQEDPGVAAYFAKAVGENMLDGIIVVPQYAGNAAYLDVLAQNTLPYVLLSPRRFARGLNHVDMKNRVGGRIVAELFHRSGRRRIAMINGPPTHIDAIERERGFASGLRAGGIERFSRSFGDFTIESGFAAMDMLLAEGVPDAVFCANDYMAAGAMQCLYKADLRVPQDVAVVGYDNSDAARIVTPALTSVDNHFLALGRALAEELLARIRGGDRAIRRGLDPVLVERQSH
jgi:DNA-binding LacI/PurR family transcriptional regulator